MRWCLPLLAADGSLVLMKGSGAADELAQQAGAVRRAGAVNARLVQCGVGTVDPTVTVVMMEHALGNAPRTRTRGRR